MTKEGINRALAEWMGWTKCVCDDPECGVWFPPSGEPALEVPNFYASLDAVHEVALKLSDVSYTGKDGQQWTERCDFMAHLERIVIRDTKVDQCNFEFYNATAPQRCEAILRTLGLWKEDV